MVRFVACYYELFYWLLGFVACRWTCWLIVLLSFGCCQIAGYSCNLQISWCAGCGVELCAVGLVGLILSGCVACCLLLGVLGC